MGRRIAADKRRRIATFTNVAYASTNTGALLLTNTGALMLTHTTYASTAADKHSIGVECEAFNLSVQAASTASFSALLIPRKVI